MINTVAAATPWYTSTSFLSFAGIVSTVVVGAVGSFVTYLVAVPRRQLLYSLQSSTSLFNASLDTRKDIRVFHLDKELSDPHIVKVSLLSRGRSDIPSEAFDQGRPINIDLGAPIIAQLPAEKSIELGVATKIDTEMLEVGPDLIGKRKQMVFNLLTDGGVSSVHLDCYLIDVKVREQKAPGIANDPIYQRSMNLFLIVLFIALSAEISVASVIAGALIATMGALVGIALLVIAFLRIFDGKRNHS